MQCNEMFELKTKEDADRSGKIRMINLDANANTTVTNIVIDAVTAALRDASNPSSTHEGGATARAILTGARDAVSAMVHGACDDDVVFTSGCTEANNTIVNAAVSMGATLVTTEVEHPSVLACANALSLRAHDIRLIGVDADGVINFDQLKQVLDAIDGPVLVSVQFANSETGVIQPISRIAALLEGRSDVLFHSDAAQAFGKIPVRVGSGAPHVVSISGHKLHGPMGVGAIITAQGETRISPLLLGGDQQGGRRAGTEPVALISGLSAACAARASTMLADTDRMATLRDRLERSLLERIPAARVNGAAVDRLPNTSSITFAGVDGMALVARLDAEGVLVSQGSACSSMRPTPSHVLLAMGMSEDEAFSTIRFAVSPLNTADEIDTAVEAVIRISQRGSFL